MKAHSADPVPILICGGGLKPDNIPQFGESAVKNGSLGKMLGSQILPTLAKFAKA
jgi:2,3-bisphosphoglycerate-independent phosphoglycerate mutase